MMVLAGRIAGLALFSGVLLAWASLGPLHAQEGTEALGTPVGVFIIYPSLTVDTEYNDNIYATEDNEKEDVIFRFSPEVIVQSDWDNHELKFLASATFNQYVDQTEEDVIDYQFLTSGRVDILEDTSVSPYVGITHNHEDRGSSDDQNGKEPTEYTILGGGFDFNHAFDPMWTLLSGSAGHFDYDNVNAIGGGEINNNDRDRMEYTSLARVGYDFNPEVGAFLQGHFDYQDYDNRPDDQGTDRNAYEYGVAVGAQFDVTDVILGNVFGGYQWRQQSDDDFQNENTYNIGAGLTWFPTELTTVDLIVSRQWEETTVNNASSALTTNAGVTVSHSLLDTVTLNAFFDFTKEDFEGANRTDNTYSAGPSVTYLMNRFVHWNLGYSYTQRDSDAAGEDYTENLVFLSMRLQY